MGNRALRKKLGEELRRQGIPSKVYRGKGNKHSRAAHLRRLLRFVSLTEGDIVQDCNGQNNRVTAYPTWGISGHALNWFQDHPWREKRGVSGYFFNVDNQIYFGNGQFSCGCGSGPYPKRSLEDVEKYFVEFYKAFKDSWASDGWYGEAVNSLLNGGKVFDEDGIMLPEWRKRSQERRT